MSDENLSPEDQLAAAFERAGMKDDPEPVEQDEPDEETAAEADESADDSGEPAAEADEPPSEDAEEVEYEGKQYKLPKELKEALLRQQDYTRKTQEVADRRRFVEQQEQALELQRQFQSTHADKVAQLRAVESQLQQYAQVNWAALAQDNPTQYMELLRQRMELQEVSGKLNGEVQKAATEFEAQITDQRRKAQALCVEELKREFKDFGPEFIRNLDETGRSFGFSGEELAQIVDPRVIRVLHAAAQYQRLRTAKPIAEKKVPTVEARPMAVKAARTANQSMQSAKLTEARTRLQKTGKSSDAEAFLEMRFAKAMR